MTPNGNSARNKLPLYIISYIKCKLTTFFPATIKATVALRYKSTENKIIHRVSFTPKFNIT